MTPTHEAIVASRFDAIHERFKPGLAPDDARLVAILASLGPLEGLRVLELGCGKGRFARALASRGADVIGLDVSRAMLAAANGLDRVQASVRRLPFQSSSFDAAIAVEVFEHLDPRSLDDVLAEVQRALRRGGRFLIVDKNVRSWNAQRPWLPSVVLKWIDERRGLWMYSRADRVRERWFLPGALKRQLQRWFCDVEVIHLRSRAENGRFPFEYLPGTRLFAMWAGRAPGGIHE
jgi:2-polyprenyl-6-hydroxyphenyl methylase/3-demethylubiquinone-9 3-methyltransferase